MTQDKASQLAALFRLLGEPNRLRLVVECLHGPQSVGERIRAVGVGQS